MTVQIAVRRLPHGTDMPLPAYATAGAAGMDLLAAVEAPVTIDPGKRALIPTGLAIALPPGYELQVRPRSGLALRHGIVLPNSPGTIDEDYRGEVQVIVLNAGDAPFTIERGARIAQAVLAPVVRARWHEVASLDATVREVAAPKANHVLAHAERLGNLWTGPASQSQQNRPRPVRFPAITGAGKRRKRGSLFVVGCVTVS